MVIKTVVLDGLVVTKAAQSNMFAIEHCLDCDPWRIVINRETWIAEIVPVSNGTTFSEYYDDFKPEDMFDGPDCGDDGIEGRLDEIKDAYGQVLYRIKWA